jgi:hypothetical protein
MSLKAILRERSMTASVRDPGGGTMDHTRLHGREEPDQHPVESITGLRDALAQKLGKAHAENLDNPHGVTAAQVGARPDTWLPTATEVGARPADWLPTAADVAAAPAQESDQYPGCYYRMVEGRQEWLNPPLVAGKKYATTRRWNGKTVYTCLVDVGMLPNNASKTVTVTSEQATVISMEGVADSGRECNAFPVVFSGNVVAYSYTFPNEEIGARITVKTLADLSAYRAWYIISYVKE